MPLLRTEIELPAVLDIMHSRGYGDHHDGRYALSFNKKDPTARWQMTKEPKRVPVGGGVSKEQLKRILTHSETPVEAADRIEAIICGAEMLPLEALPAQAGPSIDTAVMEKMIENRTDAQIGRHLKPVIDVLGKLTDRLEAMEAKLTPAPEAKKKGGRPKGSKNKPKEQDVNIDFGPRAKSNVAQ